jgi:ribosomal-protein-alanine N-acetyltransferase
VNIRVAKWQDLSFLIELERSSPSAAHWTDQHYREAADPESGGPERLFLVCESLPASPPPEHSKASAITGFVVASHVAPEWQLENIVVSPNARRQAVGTHLLGALLARAQQTNSDSVFLEVRESNTAARALYEKSGFRPSGRRKLYYSDPPEDAILYRRSLR